MSFSIGNLINFLNPAAPKGLIDSAADWVHRRRLKDDLRTLQPSAWYRKVGEESEMIFHDPGLGSASDFPELPNVRWTIASGATLFYIAGARILGEEAAVIAPDNRVFREFSYPPSSDWLEHSCFLRRRIPPVRTLKGWYATIAYPSSIYYFHWMMESLPRMKLLQDYVGILDGLIVPGPLTPFHRQSLGALGIPESKLISVGPGTHLEAEHLFIPRYCAVYNPAAWVHRWYKESFLGKTVARVPGSDLRKIYVSRADANARKVKNEAEIIDYLRPLGFEIVSLTGMDFLEQARVFFNADAIIAPHGAGLANLVFCNAGTRVLEICPPNWMPPCYFALAKSANLLYSYMVAAESSANLPSEQPQMRDISIPLDPFRERVDDLLKS